MDKITKHIVAELTGYKLHTMDVSQGDRRSRQIRLRLLENGIPWSAPEGARVVVSYQLPDGTPGSYDTMPDGSPAGAVERNVVTAQLADQLTTQAGAADISVVLLGSEGQQLAMWPVRLRVVGPEKITIPENLPALGAGYEEKLLFGGEGGVLQPLAIGTGLYIEDDTLHAKGGSGSSGPAYVASELPPENTKAMWVNTSEQGEAVALGATAVETAEGADLYCTDELGTTKVTVLNGRDGAQGPRGEAGPAGPAGPQGAPGEDYVLTDDDVQKIAEIVAGMVEVPDGGNGGTKEFVLLYDNTITLTEPVKTITDSLLVSCEDMTEFVGYGSYTANLNTETGNDRMNFKVGKVELGGGQLEDPNGNRNFMFKAEVCGDRAWTESIAMGNGIPMNGSYLHARWRSFVIDPDYSTFTFYPYTIGYQGTITLKLFGR